MGIKKNIDCDIIKITNGPENHLFGFHDLVISDKSEKKFLCLEVDDISRPTIPGETFGVGYAEDGNFVKLGETYAMNYPQGARQQWIAESEYFTVNNKVGDVWGTDIYDAASGNKVNSLPAPTHMLSKDGKYSFGLDYARIFRLGGYGYCGIADCTADEEAPSGSGITVMDMKSGEVKLLVSVAEVAACGSVKTVNGYHQYLTHLCLNPSSSRIAFLHRYPLADGGEMTRLMTIGTDGKDLRCLASGFLSHFDWKDDNHIYIFGRVGSSFDALRSNPLLTNPLVSFALKGAKTTVKFLLGKKNKPLAPSSHFLMISDEAEPLIRPYATDIITEDGHPMSNPVNRDWCISDTYPDMDGIRTLMLYNFPSELRIDIGTFRKLDKLPDMSLRDQFFCGVNLQNVGNINDFAFHRSGLHCDLHPRWSASGSLAVFDSIHEGTRQIYAVNVNDIIKNNLL